MVLCVCHLRDQDFFFLYILIRGVGFEPWMFPSEKPINSISLQVIFPGKFLAGLFTKMEHLMCVYIYNLKKKKKKKNPHIRLLCKLSINEAPKPHSTIVRLKIIPH